jgi:hypothetical protein
MDMRFVRKRKNKKKKRWELGSLFILVLVLHRSIRTRS